MTTKKITLETKSKLSKLVPDGTVLWAVDTDLSQAVKIVAEPNGVVVGGQNASNQIILQKLGLSGNSIWKMQVSDGLLTSLLKTPDGGYVVGTSTPRFIKLSPEQNNTSPVTTNLTLTAPAYNCATGTLAIFVTGSNGRVEFRVAGLRDWGNTNVLTVPTHQLTGTTFNLEARQSGQITTMRAFTTACGTTPPVNPPVTPLTGTFAILTPGYDCNTGQLTAQVANAGGAAVEYRIAGLRDWATSNSFSVPSYQRNGTTFKIEARTNGGAYATMDFASACGTTPPVAPPVTPPTTPLLAFVQIYIECKTGRLLVLTNGGDGTTIELRSPGLQDWRTLGELRVPEYQMIGTTFTIYVRQSGREITRQFITACGTARVANPETGIGWQVSVLGNPVDEQVQLRLSGLAGQTVGLSLSDATGRVLLERQVSVQTEGQTQTLNLRGSAGVYLLRAIRNGQQQTVKVLKK